MPYKDLIKDQDTVTMKRSDVHLQNGPTILNSDAGSYKSAVF